MRRTLPFMAAVFLAAAAVVFSSCGGGESPRAWLDDCHEAAAAYAQEGGYLHFEEEMRFELEGEENDFQQEIAIEGDCIFPDRQRYEYTETWSSSQLPGEPRENAFSYLTVDQGKTAFVEGERLLEQLGVIGWVHYTPPADENRYFNYLDFLESLTGAYEEMEWAGYEEVDGTRCVHLLYMVSGQELLDMRLQEDPSLQEKYENVDVGELFEDLRVEIWIREADSLPQRVIMSQVLIQEDSGTTSVDLTVLFSGYGEEPPALIEQPAFYSEAA